MAGQLAQPLAELAELLFGEQRDRIALVDIVRHQQRGKVVEAADAGDLLPVGELLEHLHLSHPLLEAQLHRGELDGLDMRALQRMDAGVVVAEMLVGIVHPRLRFAFDCGVA